MLTLMNRTKLRAGRLGLPFVVVSFLFGSLFVSKADAQMMKSGDSSRRDVIQREDKTIDILATIDAFTETDARLKKDAAIAHYNMGNIYFEKGRYEIAAREYYQAVMLMPDDPDAHYNLAFVSSEYLDDFYTALKHYKLYLYLHPRAKDVDFVNEKIADAEMHIKMETDSVLDEKY